MISLRFLPNYQEEMGDIKTEKKKKKWKKNDEILNLDAEVERKDGMRSLSASYT